MVAEILVVDYPAKNNALKLLAFSLHPILTLTLMTYVS